MTTKRERTMWELVLPAWDQAHLAAHGATHAQRSVLFGVLWLLGSYQRESDTVRLSQVAFHAGMWDGIGTPSRSVLRHVGEHLTALAERGAITYEPSRSRRGCKIGLIVSRASAAHDDAAARAPERRMTEDDMRRWVAHVAGSGRAPERPARAPERRNTPSTCAPERPARAPQARASEDLSEDVVRGIDPRGAPLDDSASGYVDAERTGWEGATPADLLDALAHDKAGAELEVERRLGIDPTDIETTDELRRLLDAHHPPEATTR